MGNLDVYCSIHISLPEKMVDKFVGHLIFVLFKVVWLALTYYPNIYNSGWHGRWLAKNLFWVVYHTYYPLLTVAFLSILWLCFGFENSPALYSVILTASHFPYHLLIVGFIIHGLFKILLRYHKDSTLNSYFWFCVTKWRSISRMWVQFPPCFRDKHVVQWSEHWIIVPKPR